MYGIKSGEDGDASDAEEEDIESAIKKELGALTDKGKRISNSVLEEVRIKEECLLFMRCKAPIEPVQFARHICQDAASTGHGGVKARYLNRLTPLTAIAKASETGLDEAMRKALAGHFKLKSAGTEENSNPEATGTQSEAQHDGAGKEVQPATVRSRVLPGVIFSLITRSIVRYSAVYTQSQHSEEGQCDQTHRRLYRSRPQGEPWRSRQGHTS
jgi:tRNA acetyltransferase TAN1